MINKRNALRRSHFKGIELNKRKLFLSHSCQVWKSLAQVWCGTLQYQKPKPGLRYFSAARASHTQGPFWPKMAARSPDIMAAFQTAGIWRGVNPSSFKETSKKFHTLLLLSFCQPQLSHVTTHNFIDSWKIKSLFHTVQYTDKNQLLKGDFGWQEKFPPCLLT